MDRMAVAEGITHILTIPHYKMDVGRMEKI